LTWNHGLSCEDIALQTCSVVRIWRLCVFFASCISSGPRAAHFRPVFCNRIKATSCVEVWSTSNVRPLRLEEERKHERKKPQLQNIMACPLQWAAINRPWVSGSS